jgi:hypothetical protein
LADPVGAGPSCAASPRREFNENYVLSWRRRIPHLQLAPGGSDTTGTDLVPHLAGSPIASRRNLDRAALAFLAAKLQ